MTSKIINYVPQKATRLLDLLLEKYPFELKIKKNRKTKHGDFRTSHKGPYKISINSDLNKFRFLITLIHEIAHLVAYKNFGNKKPHGREWKETFKQLMLPFLNDSIFPSEILSPLAHYLINPKARTDADFNLSLALRLYDEKTDKKLIFEIETGTCFEHNKRVFKKGVKRRTRYECIEIQTQRKYLFQQNAEVTCV